MSSKSNAGSFSKGLGKTLLTIGFLAGIILQIIPAGELGEAGLFLSVLLLLFILSGAFLFFRGRQYADQASAAEIIADEKADILYLRAFRSDSSLIGQTFKSLLRPHLMSGMLTEEEQLREALKPIGDMVAIGQPGESLPKPGAARMYASDDQWKQIVTDQMKTARLVIIRAGSGRGLFWEFQQAVKVVPPEKLLILFFNMKKKDYEILLENAAHFFPQPLPDREAVQKYRVVNGFMRFSKSWQPDFLRLYAPFLRRSSYRPFQRMFQCTLKPVYESLGFPWQPPPVSLLMIGSLAFLVIFCIFIVAVLISAISQELL